MTRALLTAASLLAGLCPAFAQVVDRYDITPQEQAACQVDATALCGQAIPDEDALIACMRGNVGRLTPACRKTFLAGLQRRHL